MEGLQKSEINLIAKNKIPMRIEYFFLMASAQDVVNNLSNSDLEIDFVYLVMALVASTVGVLVRVAHENQKQKVSLARFFFMYMCAICVSYLAYEITIVTGYKKLLGPIAVVCGIISIDIITFIIEDLMTILKNILTLIIKSKTGSNGGD